MSFWLFFNTVSQFVFQLRDSNSSELILEKWVLEEVIRVFFYFILNFSFFHLMLIDYWTIWKSLNAWGPWKLQSTCSFNNKSFIRSGDFTNNCVDANKLHFIFNISLYVFLFHDQILCSNIQPNFQIKIWIILYWSQIISYWTFI